MNEQPLSLSVIICTYNNANSLLLTLTQLQNQQFEEKFKVEFIVIDNNSNDHTKEVIAGFSQNDSRFIGLHEAKQGLSHARNLGAQTATGNYLLFTDDDAELPTNWVQSYLDALDLYKPACCFSIISVIWHKPIPSWYCKVFRPQFVELDYGDSAIVVNDMRHEFFGKNFCILREEILRQGGFDPTLGRIGDKLVAGEETVIYRRMILNGEKVVYFPSAPVGHRLKDKEFTLEHINRLFLDGAYTTYNIGLNFSETRIIGRPAGVLLSAIQLLTASIPRWLHSKLTSDKPMELFYKLSILKALATIKIWILKP